MFEIVYFYLLNSNSTSSYHILMSLCIPELAVSCFFWHWITTCSRCFQFYVPIWTVH